MTAQHPATVTHLHKWLPHQTELLGSQGRVLCVLVSPSQGMVLSPLNMVVRSLNGWISLLGSGDARIVSQTLLHNTTCSIRNPDNINTCHTTRGFSPQLNMAVESS